MARLQLETDLDDLDGAPLRRLRLDTATLVGLISGFGLLAVAMAAGGAVEAYFDLPAFLIVIGGTFGVTTICFSIEDITRARWLAAKVLLNSRPDPQIAMVRMLQFAERARRGSVLALEEWLHELEGDPIAQKSIGLAVDGATPEEIERVLERDMEVTQQRHATSAGIFRKAAEIAPSMGLIGTLIGLVQMLARLDDPGSIGPSMAIALLTTFYGAILSTMLFTPLAAKLERNSAEELLTQRIYMVAAVSIGRQDNPRKLEAQLNSLLPPHKRLTYFD